MSCPVVHGLAGDRAEQDVGRQAGPVVVQLAADEVAVAVVEARRALHEVAVLEDVEALRAGAVEAVGLASRALALADGAAAGGDCTCRSRAAAD